MMDKTTDLNEEQKRWLQISLELYMMRLTLERLESLVNPIPPEELRKKET